MKAAMEVVAKEVVAMEAVRAAAVKARAMVVAQPKNRPGHRQSEEEEVGWAGAVVARAWEWA